MNKKGSVVIAIWILVVAVVMGGGYLLFAQNTATGAIEEATATSDDGKIASLKAYAVDTTNANPQTQIATTGYFWVDGEPTEILGGSAGTTLSATATATVKPVTIGDNICGVAFDSTYYGVESCKEIEDESEQMKLENLRIVDSAMTFKIYEDELEGSPSIDIGASETDAFSKMVIEQSNADEAFNLKMICFASNESTSASNIQSIEVIGLTSVAIPLGEKAQQYCSELAEAVMLNEYEEYTTGAVQITSDGDDIGAETVTVSYIDEAHFLSLEGDIKMGIHKDDASATDVGETSAQQDTFATA